MAQNSPIRSKGVGKDSKRHDLDGTPGLSKGSSLNQGDVQQLEAGQKQVQNTQSTQQAQRAQTGGQPTQQSQPMEQVDPLEMVKEKTGGTTQLPVPNMQPVDTGEFLPLMHALAKGNSSSLLKKAYMDMYANIQKQPYTAGTTALIDRQEQDRAVAEAF